MFNGDIPTTPDFVFPASCLLEDIVSNLYDTGDCRFLDENESLFEPV
jgi:hypothetical protein